MDIDILFSLFGEKYIDHVYCNEKLKKIKKVTVLTGYVSESMKKIKIKPLEDRPLDIFYRSRIYPFSLGCLAQERILISEGVQNRAAQYNLKCDISLKENKRIYGQAWIDNLQSSRAVLGTESGASILDETGEITKKLKKLFSQCPMMDFSFAYKALLSQYEGNIYYAMISPRLFEAAATHTAMILFPGEYNGILKENIHYIALRKDFSNFSEVVKKLKDNSFLKQLIHRAYQDLILSGDYADKKLSALIERELFKVANKFEKNYIPISINVIRDHLSTMKSKNTMINFIYIIMEECKFVLVNFYIFLFDSQYTGKQKLFSIYNGINRYLFYLYNRWVKRREIFFS